jgi:dihydroorotate dehydrogenase electron transfer subunit
LKRKIQEENMNIYYGTAKVFSSDKISGNTFKLVIKLPQKIDYFCGQFMRIKPINQYTPRLFKPFTIVDYDSVKNLITVFIKIVGEATKDFSKLKKGDVLEIHAPCGNPETESQILKIKSSFILVGGGAGMFGIMSFAKLLSDNNRQTKILIGAKDLKDVPNNSNLNFHEIIKIEEKNGFVTELLEKELKKQTPTKPTVIACGPRAMLKKVSQICDLHKNRYFLILEEYMACGIGTCCGCAVSVKGGEYKKVCKDGPVFDGKIIDWKRTYT